MNINTNAKYNKLSSATSVVSNSFTGYAMKFLICIVMLLFAVLLSSCAKLEQDSSTQNFSINDAAHEAYNEVIEQYNKALTESKSSSDYAFWNSIRNKYPYVNTLDSAEPKKYCYKDLNGDGVDELITADDHSLICIYAYTNNKVCEVAKFWSRSRGFIRENNIIQVIGSGGYLTTYYDYYKYSLKDPSSNYENLSSLESCSFDALGHPSYYD